MFCIFCPNLEVLACTDDAWKSSGLTHRHMDALLNKQTQATTISGGQKKGGPGLLVNISLTAIETLQKTCVHTLSPTLRLLMSKYCLLRHLQTQGGPVGEDSSGPIYGTVTWITTNKIKHTKVNFETIICTCTNIRIFTKWFKRTCYQPQNIYWNMFLQIIRNLD